MKLERTFYVPSFSQNLISVSKLVPFGYSFNFKDTTFGLFYNFECVRNGILSNDLYLLGLQNYTTYSSMHVQTGIKRCNINDNSFMLWYQRLRHISIERIKSLVKNGVLNTLDFANFKIFVDCIKGKQTNMSKKGANKSSNILEIIHANICCPDMDARG